jgi:predicted pyridoxine 5'-phosphate oxidase superfamily flavin-nucleotide-binding protein
MSRDPHLTGQPEPDPFHAGERALQSIVGAREQIAEVGRRIMRDAMPEQHRELFAKLPFVLCGSVDPSGQPHASILAGPPGFVHAPHARELVIDALPRASDPLAANLQPGASIGLLGIEPHTRRRNRMNGKVGAIGGNGFSVIVEQSFGNCPKYIQARRAQWTAPAAVPAEPKVRHGARLDTAAERMISDADTFYIASAHPGAPHDRQRSHGVDISHRGGKPGFVRIERAKDHDVLTVPDFSGNALFNTLGNLTLHPHAGLLFIDYRRGDLLQVATEAEILWDGPELDAFAGAERLLRLQVRNVSWIQAALPLRWSEPELSPFLEDTGAWREREPQL